MSSEILLDLIFVLFLPQAILLTAPLKPLVTLLTPVPAGKVAISRKEIAKLIGRVFLQRAAVNLLSTVLDTPEYFWSAPDSMQSLYKRVCEYMELDERVEVLNNRFQVQH